jgi:hypothetical protein
MDYLKYKTIKLHNEYKNRKKILNDTFNNAYTECSEKTGPTNASEGFRSKSGKFFNNNFIDFKKKNVNCINNSNSERFDNNGNQTTNNNYIKKNKNYLENFAKNNYRGNHDQNYNNYKNDFSTNNGNDHNNKSLVENPNHKYEESFKEDAKYSNFEKTKKNIDDFIQDKKREKYMKKKGNNYYLRKTFSLNKLYYFKKF